MLDIDLDTLTLAEVEEIEELTGKAIDQLFDGPKARVMRVLYFVIARRTDPTLTFDATAALTISEVSAALTPTRAVTDS